MLYLALGLITLGLGLIGYGVSLAAKRAVEKDSQFYPSVRVRVRIPKAAPIYPVTFFDDVRRG